MANTVLTTVTVADGDDTATGAAVSELPRVTTTVLKTVAVARVLVGTTASAELEGAVTVTTEVCTTVATETGTEDRNDEAPLEPAPADAAEAATGREVVAGVCAESLKKGVGTTV